MNGGPAPLRTFERVFVIGLAALALCGCADVARVIAPPPVNPESPVAAQVQSASRRSYDVPRLIDVPPKPLNVPGAPTVKGEVIATVRCRNGVTGFALTHPPLSAATEQFASNERDLADINPADVPPPDSVQRSDAESAALRAYAAPPAALASGPPPTPAQAQPPVAAAPAPHASHRAAQARRAPPPAATVASPAAVVQPAAAAVAATESDGPIPPFPAPLPDPLLARCT